MVTENKMQGGNQGVLLTAQGQPRQEGLGRNGEGKRRGQTDPLHDELEMDTSRLSRFGSAIKGIGRAAVVTLAFAGIVGIASCSDENKNEHEDMDTDTIADTESDADTGSEDSDTGTGPFDACEEFQNDSIEDNQATVQEGDAIIIGPVGNIVEVVIADAKNQLVEGYLMDGMKQPVDKYGNPAKNESDAYVVITEGYDFYFGGKAQTLTNCGEFQTVDGTNYAMLVISTDFWKCDYVDSGGESNPEEYQVNVLTVETIRVLTHYEGLVQGPEDKEKNCPENAKAFFVQETASIYFPLAQQDNVPSEKDYPTIKMRGDVFDFIGLYDGGTVRVGQPSAVAELHEGDSATGSDLVPTYVGVDQDNKPVFSFQHASKITQFEVADMGPNEKYVSVMVNGQLLEYALRFSTPQQDGELPGTGSHVSIRLYDPGKANWLNAGPLRIKGTPYNVSPTFDANEQLAGLVETEWKG